ncbi:MAG: hypothetical protein ACC656_05845, partial [Candidatus Heimdallarchaeota archaeon]
MDKEKSYIKLKQIAVDLAEGKIFCDLQIDLERDNLDAIFMPLVFMSKEQRKNMIADGVSLLYEYYSEAGPRGVNGKPCFFSMRFLTKKEVDVMLPEYLKYVEIRKNFLEDFEPYIPIELVNNILT